MQINNIVSSNSKPKNQDSMVELALKRKYFDKDNYNYKDQEKDTQEDIIEDLKSNFNKLNVKL